MKRIVANTINTISVKSVKNTVYLELICTFLFARHQTDFTHTHTHTHTINVAIKL